MTILGGVKFHTGKHASIILYIYVYINTYVKSLMRSFEGEVHDDCPDPGNKICEYPVIAL